MPSLETIWRFLVPPRRHVALTSHGAVFCTVTLLIALAALNTSAQLLFLVFSMMCAFLVLSAVLATSSLRRLAARREAPAAAEAGKPVRVRIAIRNGKRRIPAFSLRVADTLATGEEVGAAFFQRIPGRTEAAEHYECVFPRRGLYEFASIGISTRFPFGLIERRLWRGTSQSILVYPRTVDLRAALEAARVDIGEREALVRGHGAGLYGLRQYQPTDSARDIHWPVSARAGRLMTREYESEEHRRASIVLDNRLPEPPTHAARERLETAIVLASSLLGLLIQDGHQVELLTASGKVPFDTGPAHLRRCRRALALLQAESLSTHAPHLHPSTADSLQFVLAMGEGPSGRASGVVTLEVAEFRRAVEEQERRASRGFAPLAEEESPLQVV